MRYGSIAAALTAALLAGCGYYPVPPDPLRIVDSPADVAACRRLGSAGPPVRTDGEGPFLYGRLTAIVPAGTPGGMPLGTAPAPGFGAATGDHFGMRLNAMRDAAIEMGATDLLLVRRILRDWSYVEGVAYFCRR